MLPLKEDEKKAVCTEIDRRLALSPGDEWKNPELWKLMQGKIQYIKEGKVKSSVEGFLRK